MEPDEYSFQQMQTGEKRNPNYASFYLHPVLNNVKTKAAGREIYDDKTYILILCPGQSKTEVRRPATDIDKREYPDAWKAFQEGKATPISGTPIEQLPGVTPGRAMELHKLHIRTIEQLVEVPDQNMHSIGMDGYKLRDQAKAFVEKNTAEIQALRSENAELKKALSGMKAQMLELTGRLDTLSSRGQQPAPIRNPKRKDAGAIPNENL